MYAQIDPTVKSSDFRSTRFLQFDLASDSTSSDSSSGGSTDTQLKYETGDHAVIIPKNDKQLVKELCDLIVISPYQWFIQLLVSVYPFNCQHVLDKSLKRSLTLLLIKKTLWYVCVTFVCTV
jgi:sulfite reductase alpha subunit-like flavoprotein